MSEKLGIIFTGGESPPPSVIKHLTEGVPALFIAADSGLSACESAGIEPDYIIGDMDSIDGKRLESQPSQKIIRYPCDKDYTDTELAFSLALEKGCGKIWIIGGGGGRIDHLFGIRSLFERELFPSRWITEAADIYCVDAKMNNVLSCSVQKEDIVSVFPLGDRPWKAESSALKWQLDNVTWSRGFFGVSNVALEESFSVTAKEGRFMVILPEIRIKGE